VWLCERRYSHKGCFRSRDLKPMTSSAARVGNLRESRWPVVARVELRANRGVKGGGVDAFHLQVVCPVCDTLRAC
jgi:hypothetical protein